MNSSTWNTGKRNHLRLANAAAATYDASYAEAAFATHCYMAFEEFALRDAAKDAPGYHLALDLGCGTGRLSRVLAQQFARVWGCDLSPVMVEQARQSSSGGQGIAYTIHDVEKGHLPFNRNCVDLINAGFGLFSFVWDSERFVADIRRVLRPGGLFTLSCYNAGVLPLPPETPWVPALNARVDAQGVCVTHEGEAHWINARAFTPQQVRALLEPAFEVEAVICLPTLAAVLPAALVEEARVRALCAAVDAAVALREDLAAGAYLWVRAHKRGKSKSVSMKNGRATRGAIRERTGVRRANGSPTLACALVS